MHFNCMWKLKEKLRLPLWVMPAGGEGQGGCGCDQN